MRAFVGSGLLFVSAFLAAPAGAAVVNVDCAKHDLQAKIDGASPGDTLRVKGRCVGQFTIAKSLTLDGTPSATLDGVEDGRTLSITGTPTVRLLDLTVTGGHLIAADSDGAGIRQAGGSLTLRRVVVEGNRTEGVSVPSGFGSATGGGIAAYGSRLTLVDSSVRNNTALTSGNGAGSAFGGGIYKQGALTLERSVVSGNRAQVNAAQFSAGVVGGGIVAVNGVARVLSSRITGNRAVAKAVGTVTATTAYGGGVFLSGSGRLSATRSIFGGNVSSAVGPGGNVIASGGAVDGEHDSAVFERSVFTANEARARSTLSGSTAAYGGALNLQTDELHLVRSRVTESVARAESGGPATAAGGAIVQLTGETLIRASRVASSVAEAIGGSGTVRAQAGGLQAAGLSVRIATSTVHGNVARASGVATARANGGGVEVTTGSSTVTASTVSGNTASGPTATGGGVSIPSVNEHAITSSTVAGNRATGDVSLGGGVESEDELTVSNSTVARNRADIAGGLYVDAGPITLKGTVVALNVAATAPDCEGSFSSAGWNLIGNATLCLTPAATDRANVAAKLGPLRANGGPTRTIMPRAGSPAMNWVPNAQCPAKDQRGVKRPQGPRCEIGSVERRAGRRP